jgi:copper homeostasis protein
VPNLVEVYIGDVESALAAQAGGAARIELCDNLPEGGTTPSAGVIELARRALTIAINVMIRPRGGDFCYSALEFEVMQRDIDLARQLGVDGVVLGLLNPNGTVDAARTAALIDRARPLSVTFHRAFDMTRDPVETLDTLITLGVDRILTSGYRATAEEGLDTIAQLHRAAAGRVIIMAGGGVNAGNARRIVEATGITEIHLGSAGTSYINSPMVYRNPAVFMGSNDPEEEYRLRRTSAERVRAVVEAIQ